MIPDKKRILLVDDETDILELLQYNFEQEGYLVRCASSGHEAIKVAAEWLPHVILIDIMMPVMDGIEAGRQIRQIPLLTQTMLVFLTARTEEYSEVAAFDIGANDYITKPIKMRALLSRVRALLGRQPTDQPESGRDEIVVDEYFKIFVKNHSISYLDRVTLMPKKEFDLLLFLYNNTDRVFSRQEILLNVWGVGMHVSHRTIDVHIRKIREKIGDRYLKTIKGVGYLFSSRA
jgi:two-component system, OmpR family, alkaline phosphatase synthesis response regulator PhoP